MIALLFMLSLASPEQSVLAELERIDRKLVKNELELQELTAASNKLTQELATLATERAAAELLAAEARVRFTRRLRALARLPSGARVMLLGDAASFADYLELSRMLRAVTSHDQKLYRQYKEEHERALEVASQVARRKEELAVAVTAARSRRDLLATKRGERVAYLAAALTDPTRARRTHEEQRLAHSSLGTMLARLEPAARLRAVFAENRGRLPWPVLGEIRDGFGDVIDPRLGTSVSHPGLSFTAKVSAKVSAVAAGEVVHVGWMRGYGQVVIIDHGGGYHTVYAHLATLDVERGDILDSGAALGQVGDSGSYRGLGLYFELRHDGVAEDPRPWLRR